jgi:hypothetical protein
VGRLDPDAGKTAIWTQHTVTNGSKAAVAWYELLPSKCKTGFNACGLGATRQKGAIATASAHFWNAAISPNMKGNSAVVIYNTDQGTAGNKAMQAQSRSSATPLGQMGGPSSATSASNAVQSASCTTGPMVCAWGIRASAGPDPVNAKLVWGSNMIPGPPSGTSPRWLTFHFVLKP